MSTITMPHKADLFSTLLNPADPLPHRLVTDCPVAYLRGWVNYGENLLLGWNRGIWRFFLSADAIEAAGVTFDPATAQFNEQVRFLITKWPTDFQMCIEILTWAPVIDPETEKPLAWYVTGCQDNHIYTTALLTAARGDKPVSISPTIPLAREAPPTLDKSVHAFYRNLENLARNGGV